MATICYSFPNINFAIPRPLQKSEWMGEHPGTLFTLTHTHTHTYKHTLTHMHAHTPTRADEINKIAEFRWRAIAKHRTTHALMHAHTHTHARTLRIHTQMCGPNCGKSAARCWWRAAAKGTQSYTYIYTKVPPKLTLPCSQPLWSMRNWTLPRSPRLACRSTKNQFVKDICKAEQKRWAALAF